jgi:hypothetical protein
MKIAHIEVAKAVIAHEAVDCFVGKEAPSSKQPTSLVSCTGGVFWGKPGEEWPRSANGRPLIPWLQIVCAEMKGVQESAEREGLGDCWRRLPAAVPLRGHMETRQ